MVNSTLIIIVYQLPYKYKPCISYYSFYICKGFCRRGNIMKGYVTTVVATRVSPVSLNQESLKHFPLTNQKTGQKKLCHKTALNCPQNADSVEILTGREEIGIELEACFKGRVAFRLLNSAETDGWMISLQTQM